jgi:hypothetical protein
VNVGLRLISSPDEAWDMIVGILNLGSREQHKVAEAVRLGFAWNFAHESGGGEPWAPLAPMTVAERHQLGFAGEHPILQRTRELKRSLVEEDHPLSITEISTHGYYSQLSWARPTSVSPCSTPGGSPTRAILSPPGLWPCFQARPSGD